MIQISAEFTRLESEKVLMIKEIVLKKCLNLEEICFSTHLFPPLDWDKDRIEHLLHAGRIRTYQLRHLGCYGRLQYMGMEWPGMAYGH